MMNRKLLFSLCSLAFFLLIVACNKQPGDASQAASGAATQPVQDPNAPVPPRLLKGVHAQFPNTLWDKPGTVTVSAVVGVDGKVGDTKVMNSPHPELNQLATDAVKQWQFDPARKAGKPVPYMVTVNVKFETPAPDKTVPGQPTPSTAVKPKP